MLGCRILTGGLGAAEARKVLDIQVAEGVLCRMVWAARDQGLVLEVPKVGVLVICVRGARGGVGGVVRDRVWMVQKGRIP
jgi:hypothetical protein